MEQLLLYGLGIWLLTRLRKKDDEVTDNTTPDVVDFTAQNVNAYKNLNTKSLFDRRLATSARRVTPDGTGKNIVDGTYKCFAPGSAQRIAAIKKVYEDLERLRIRIANSTGERREEARKDRREKDDERAILVAEHYMLCEKWFEDYKKRQATPAQSIVTTTEEAKAIRTVG
jgi:hypothetical protein